MNFLITTEPLELLRWDLGPANKTSSRIFSSQKHTPLSFYACANYLFWNVARLYRPMFWYLKLLLIFQGWRQKKILKLSKVCLLEKRNWLMTSFSTFDVIKIGFWSVNYTLVMWTSQGRHQLSIVHKGYPWYKFQVDTKSRSWDTRGRGCSPHLCMFVIVEKVTEIRRVNTILPTYLISSQTNQFPPSVTTRGKP